MLIYNDDQFQYKQLKYVKDEIYDINSVNITFQYSQFDKIKELSAYTLYMDQHQSFPTELYLKALRSYIYQQIFYPIHQQMLSISNNFYYKAATNVTITSCYSISFWLFIDAKINKKTIHYHTFY